MSLLRNLPLALLLSAAALSRPTHADDVTAAEHDRISDELARLAKRQVWTGAEKKFQELERLGVELSLDDYLYGAYAARENGDVLRAYERLQRAARIGGNKEIVDWLWDIDHNYGKVELLMVPSRPAELTAAEMPFDPNQRKAVEGAIKSAKADGMFIGMLPKGNYDFAGQVFTVDPGVAVRIEVSPKVRKHGPIDPVIRRPLAPGAVVPIQSEPAPTSSDPEGAEPTTGDGTTASPN